jgi:DNA-binding Xre family transcriptional regulator
MTQQTVEARMRLLEKKVEVLAAYCELLQKYCDALEITLADVVDIASKEDRDD